jgi:predicted peptidase
MIKWLFGLLVVFFLSASITFLFLKMKGISPGMVYRSLIMEAAIYSNHGKQLPYRLYKPRQKNNEQRLPLVVVLHSAPPRGEDNFKQLRSDMSVFVSKRFQKLERAFVLVPQCPGNAVWINAKPRTGPFLNYDMTKLQESWRETHIMEIIKSLISQYRIDPERIYLVGRSMGADAVWDMLYRFPNAFAAAIILNGRTDPHQARHISQTPIRFFHGKNDKITPISNALSMQAALNEFNTDAKLEIIDTGHGIHLDVYTEPVLRWLLSQRKEQSQFIIRK